MEELLKEIQRRSVPQIDCMVQAVKCGMEAVNAAGYKIVDFNNEEISNIKFKVDHSRKRIEIDYDFE